MGLVSVLLLHTHNTCAHTHSHMHTHAYAQHVCSPMDEILNEEEEEIHQLVCTLQSFVNEASKRWKREWLSDHAGQCNNMFVSFCCFFIFYFFLTGYVCTESPVVTHYNAVVMLPVMEEWQNSGILWSVVWVSVCSSTCISTNATFQHCVHAV